MAEKLWKGLGEQNENDAITFVFVPPGIYQRAEVEGICVISRDGGGMILKASAAFLAWGEFH